MKIFFGIILVIAIVVGILLIIGLFTKKDYSLEREIVINKPRQEVFNYVKLLRNQDDYNKWVMVDPGMKKDFRGTDGTVGFVYAWDSNDKNAGKGEQEIIRMTDSEQLEVEIRFEKPFKGIAHSNMYLTDGAGGQSTRLRNTFSSRMAYPMNVMLLFVNFDKTLGKDLQSSLEKLKYNLENR